jgi:plasmid stability protein
MPDLLVRNLDRDVLKRLKLSAEEHRRSLQAEIHEILERASTRNLAETRRLSSRWLKHLQGTAQSDSTDLIREDRERR